MRYAKIIFGSRWFPIVTLIISGFGVLIHAFADYGFRPFPDIFLVEGSLLIGMGISFVIANIAYDRFARAYSKAFREHYEQHATEYMYRAHKAAMERIKADYPGIAIVEIDFDSKLVPPDYKTPTRH